MNPADLLTHVSIFRSLSAEHRQALAERLVEVRCQANDIVFTAGAAAASMFVVQSGAVQIFLPNASAGAQPARVVLRELRAGDYFGELSLFDGKPRSASARATMGTVLLELTHAQFTEYLRDSSEVALTLLRDMAERLRDTNDLLSQRAAKDAIAELEENRRWSERLADAVAELNGSWAFILFLLVLTGVWGIINLPGVAAYVGYGAPTGGFDPYPYIFFNLLLAILVALQGPLIVMSQNRQSLKDRRQAECDFRVNLKNEIGIEALQRELTALRAEIALEGQPNGSTAPEAAASDSVQGRHVRAT